MQIIQNNLAKNILFTANPQLENAKAFCIESFIPKYTNDVFELKKDKKTNDLTEKSYDNFTSQIMTKINNIQKLKNPSSKSKILNQLAFTYYQSGDIDKAGVILASSFNNLDIRIISEKDKKELIENKRNIGLLKDFFYCSNNQDAKLFVIKSLVNMGSKTFLPIAEDICDAEEAVVSVNDKKTIYQARQFINKHYNLYSLEQVSKTEEEKIAMLNILLKWGLEEHTSITRKLIEDDSARVAAKAENINVKLQNLQKNFLSDKIKSPPNKPFEKQDLDFSNLTSNDENIYAKSLNRLKFQKKPADNQQLKSILLAELTDEKKADLIKILGQTSRFYEDIIFIDSLPTKNNKVTIAQKEACMKIALRR